MIPCNEQPLQRVTSDFLQPATSATSNKEICNKQREVCTTSGEQRVNFNKY